MWTYQHADFAVHQLPALNDNYIYLIEARHAPILAAVDPAEAEPVVQACRKLGNPLTHILNTHHHWDHTGANVALKQQYSCQIVGNMNDAARIPDIDISLSPDTTWQLAAMDGAGHLDVQIIDVPGHTLGHIAYLIDDALFCGDTLFGAGCGRLFEGSPGQMWHSLNRLARLPAATLVYCAHEYTLANLDFASAMDGGNAELAARLERDTAARRQQQPTIPSTIGVEKATNPFLRPLDAEFCRAYAGRTGIAADPLSVFTHVRESKDQW
jgi:hydroxyacylglutathione hydrolase